MKECKSSISDPYHYYRKKPRQVYKAKLGCEDVLVKEIGNSELRMETTRTQVAEKLLRDKIRIPDIICTDTVRKRLVLEFIPDSETLDDRIERLYKDGKCNDIEELLEQLAEVLTNIHKSPVPMKKRDLNSNRNFTGIGTILDRDIDTIKNGFKDLEEQLERARKFALENIKQKDDVLSHGDFKPNNILISEENQIAVVDWFEFGIAVRQLDLGSVLLFLEEPQRRCFVDRYISKMDLDENCEILEKTSLIIAGIIHSAGVANLCRNYENCSDKWCKLQAEIFDRFKGVLDSL